MATFNVQRITTGSRVLTAHGPGIVREVSQPLVQMGGVATADPPDLLVEVGGQMRPYSITGVLFDDPMLNQAVASTWPLPVTADSLRVGSTDESWPLCYRARAIIRGMQDTRVAVTVLKQAGWKHADEVVHQLVRCKRAYPGVLGADAQVKIAHMPSGWSVAAALQAAAQRVAATHPELAQRCQRISKHLVKAIGAPVPVHLQAKVKVKKGDIITYAVGLKGEIARGKVMKWSRKHGRWQVAPLAGNVAVGTQPVFVAPTRVLNVESRPQQGVRDGAAAGNNENSNVLITGSHTLAFNMAPRTAAIEEGTTPGYQRKLYDWKPKPSTREDWEERDSETDDDDERSAAFGYPYGGIVDDPVPSDPRAAAMHMRKRYDDWFRFGGRTGEGNVGGTLAEFVPVYQSENGLAREDVNSILEAGVKISIFTRRAVDLYYNYAYRSTRDRHELTASTFSTDPPYGSEISTAYDQTLALLRFTIGEAHMVREACIDDADFRMRFSRGPWENFVDRVKEYRLAEPLPGLIANFATDVLTTIPATAEEIMAALADLQTLLTEQRNQLAAQAASIVVEEAVRTAGRERGPGIPDGTGPFGDTPQCQLNEDEDEEEASNQAVATIQPHAASEKPINERDPAFQVLRQVYRDIGAGWQPAAMYFDGAVVRDIMSPRALKEFKRLFEGKIPYKMNGRAIEFDYKQLQRHKQPDLFEGAVRTATWSPPKITKSIAQQIVKKKGRTFLFDVLNDQITKHVPWQDGIRAAITNAVASGMSMRDAVDAQAQIKEWGASLSDKDLAQVRDWIDDIANKGKPKEERIKPEAWEKGASVRTAANAVTPGMKFKDEYGVWQVERKAPGTTSMWEIWLTSRGKGHKKVEDESALLKHYKNVSASALSHFTNSIARTAGWSYPTAQMFVAIWGKRPFNRDVMDAIYKTPVTFKDDDGQQRSGNSVVQIADHKTGHSLNRIQEKQGLEQETVLVLSVPKGSEKSVEAGLKKILQPLKFKVEILSSFRKPGIRQKDKLKSAAVSNVEHFARGLSRSATDTGWRSAPTYDDFRKMPEVGKNYGAYTFYVLHGDDSPAMKREEKKADDALKKVNFNQWGVMVRNWPDAKKEYLRLVKQHGVESEAV